MVAEIICVGTELLMGNTVNTNATFIARKLADLGISVYYQIVVGDNPKRLTEAVKIALDRADMIITSGGLGPTEDDLTKETIVEAMGSKLIFDDHTKERIEEYFSKLGKYKTISENNWKQAYIPEDGFAIDNENGTAPGIVCEKNGKIAVLLPGPPYEMKPMMENSVVPYLSKMQKDKLFSKMIKICGIGESSLETQILDIIDNQTNSTIAPYAKLGEVNLRITAKADSEYEAERLIEPVASELRKRFKNYIYAEDEFVTLEDAIVNMLKERNYTIATAESCTGGLMAGRIINVSGASDCINESFVTYSNEAKMKRLGVKEDTLQQYGAVSEQTAYEMAKGVANATDSNVGLSSTGIAGPGGGTKEKPVGLVYVGCSINGVTKVRKFQFSGNRENNRNHTVQCALVFLRECLLGIAPEEVLEY